MQDKRYQIFLSSTFTDLTDERTKVMQALLEMDCIPSGMEFFPASNEETFDFIKTVIDQSDYYILIVSGRYGSLAEDGFSYTEKEYDYALSVEIPVLSFIRKDTSELPVSKTDRNDILTAKLTAFRSKILDSGKICKLWSNSDELTGQVVTTLNHAIKRYPRPGWVRGVEQATVPNELRAIQEAYPQQKPIDITQSKSHDDAPLAEMDDIYEIKYTTRNLSGRNFITRNHSISISWREICIMILSELTKAKTKTGIELIIKDQFKDRKSLKIHEISNYSLRQILTQIELFGFISTKIARATDGTTQEFFFRTDSGRNLVVKEMAVTKEK